MALCSDCTVSVYALGDRREMTGIDGGGSSVIRRDDIMDGIRNDIDTSADGEVEIVEAGK